MSGLYFLIKAGSSERVCDREGKPIKYVSREDAEGYADDFEARLHARIEPISEREYLRLFWLEEQALRRELLASLKEDE